jgi:DNA repair exonuclease SbcCD ATPase subunit
MFLVHLSDLHIRNDADKYVRYKQVFETTVASIKETMQGKEFIIVITGDVFHNKSNISSYGLLLYRVFIAKLCELAKVILFHGNHDKNINDAMQPSLVYSSSFNIDNLMILKKTTSFTIGDVGFSYVSIDDTAGVALPSLPRFPDVSGKHRVALFHGTFVHSKLHNGSVLDGYPLEWIEDFDYALLGDVHKRQVSIYKKKTMYGYSGSLVQQNYGEDIIDHGYLVWDLDERKATPVNVYDEFGYINVKQISGDFFVRMGGKYNRTLSELMGLAEFPKILEIKLHSLIDHAKLKSLLQGVSYDIITSDTPVSIIEEPTNLLVVDNDMMLDYFKQYMCEQQYDYFLDIIKNKELLLLSDYPQEIQCDKYNSDLKSAIESCMKVDVEKRVMPKFRIKYIEWENIYCYDSVSWINFYNMHAKTFLVQGKNGTGKSTIYDVIALAIWGSITPSKQNSLSRGIINCKKTNAYTVVDIETGGKLYRIVRTFGHRKDSNLIDSNNRHLYEVVNSKLHKIKFDVIGLVGTLDNFVTSSMLTQNMDNDILQMGYKECIDIIDKTYNIDYINKLYDLFKVALNKYKDVKKTIESKHQVYHNLDMAIVQDIDADLLDSLIASRDALQKECDELLVDMNDTTDYERLLRELEPVEFDETRYKALASQYANMKWCIEQAKKYTPTLVLAKESVEKPCDMEFIKWEEKALEPYLKCDMADAAAFCAAPSKYESAVPAWDDSEMQKVFKSVKEMFAHYDKLNPQDALDSLEEIMLEKSALESTLLDKPNPQKAPKISPMFRDLEELEEFCSKTVPLAPAISRGDITFAEYQSLLDSDDSLDDAAVKLDREIKVAYDKQSKLVPVSKPKMADVALAEVVDADALKREISKISAALAEYEKKSVARDTKARELQKYSAEYDTLTTRDEYKYDPKCKFCNMRPWVARINKLKVLIDDLQSDVNLMDIGLKDHQKTKSELDKKTRLLLDHEVRQSWVAYNAYRKDADEIHAEIMSLMEQKNAVNAKVAAIKRDKEKRTAFINSSHAIYAQHLQHIKYNAWLDVKAKLDAVNERRKDFLARTLCQRYKKAKEYQEWLDQWNWAKRALENAPRVERLRELKAQYRAWEEHQRVKDIINCHEYVALDEQRKRHDRRIYLERQAQLMPSIKRKRVVRGEIKELDSKIKAMREQKTKIDMINEHNRRMQESHSVLQRALEKTENVVAILDVAITHFQKYRIWLYENHILRHICDRANELIAQLCHKETKKFKLSYNIVPRKEFIHINWLVDTVSAKQASGFQRFVMSLALRMSLYSNKQNVLCDQIFIDEGFVNFDKYNLSIVPQFLKGLLRHFSTVMVVSHIDLIQENVDEIAAIQKSGESSIMQFEEMVKYEKNTKKR